MKPETIEEFVNKYKIVADLTKLKKRPDGVNAHWTGAQHFKVRLARPTAKGKKKMFFYFSMGPESRFDCSVEEEVMNALAIEEDCQIGKSFKVWASNSGQGLDGIKDLKKYYAFALKVHQKLVRFFANEPKAIQELMDVDRL
jgi:hypothetical protein